MMWAFQKNNFQVEISTSVEYSTGKPKIVEKTDFWTQIPLLQGFSISTYTDQNGLKIDETWLKSNFVSLFMVICDSEIFLSRSKKNQFLVFFVSILWIQDIFELIPYDQIWRSKPPMAAFEPLEHFILHVCIYYGI